MKAPGEFLLRHAQKVTPETILVSDKRLVSAVCWFYKRNDVLLIDQGELEYGLGFEDAKDRQLNIGSLRELHDKESGKKTIVLIITKKLYEKFEHLFPKAEFEDISGNSVFMQF
jgi:4-amino-4-deoxy-L-arabinose transferase